MRERRWETPDRLTFRDILAVGERLGSLGLDPAPAAKDVICYVEEWAVESPGAFEVLFILLDPAAFQKQGKDKMMAPPTQGTKSKFVLAQEMFGIVQILIGTVFQTFSLDRLHLVRIEVRRQHQHGRVQLGLETPLKFSE